jgi:hypothetical protein
MLTAEEAVVAEGRISCSSSHRNHVTINPGKSPSANPPTAEMDDSDSNKDLTPLASFDWLGIKFIKLPTPCQLAAEKDFLVC